MSVPPYDPPPPRPERRTLTALEAGVILGVVALVALCCVGVALVSMFIPPTS